MGLLVLFLVQLCLIDFHFAGPSTEWKFGKWNPKTYT